MDDVRFGWARPYLRYGEPQGAAPQARWHHPPTTHSAEVHAIQDLGPHWPALNRLLDEALSLPRTEHDTWLARLGETDAALKDTLRRLLAVQAGLETGDFLGTLPRLETTADADHPAGPQAGDLVGPYRLLRELGVGGMGAVWLAERADGQLKRQIALKLPRLSWAGGLAERMARERDILASLEHPNIARLYDAGVDGGGRPWLALEYVEGRSIDEHCRSLPPGLHKRIELLLQVAQAVAFAHSRLVVHRDLKPSNILVTAAGQVRLLDFGIAKLMQGDRAAETQLTAQAGRALTLDYASPEQIRGEPIGTASDIYSLTVVAYGLLAGTLPYRLERRSAAALEEAIAGVDPPLASDAALDRGLARALRGDLDAILNKGLKKAPAERYPTVDAWAQDLQAVLDGRPVQARPDSLAYRTARFVRRHRRASAAAAAVTLAFALAIGVGATTLVIVALLAGLAAAWWQAALARRGRAAAEAASTLATAATARAEAAAAAEREAAADARREGARSAAIGDFMVRVFRVNSEEQADPEAARRLTARELLARGVLQIDRLRDDHPQAHAQLLRTFGQLYCDMRLYDEATALDERALEASRAVFGDEHLETQQCRLQLAGVLLGSERGDQCRALVDAAVTGLRRSAPSSWALAEGLSLETTIYAQRDSARAAAAGEAAIALMRQLPPSETGWLEAVTQQRLGRARMYGGDAEGAAATHRRAVDLFDARFGASSSHSGEARSDLAHALTLHAPFDQARDEWQRVIAIFAQHPNTSAEYLAEAHLGLARVHEGLGDLASARRASQAAIDLRQAGGPLRLGKIQMLQLEVHRADLASAEGQFAQVLELARAALAQVPPYWTAGKISLLLKSANAHRWLGDHPAADEAIAQVLSLIEADGAPRILRLEVFSVAAACAAALGDAATAQDRLDQAGAALGQAADQRRARFGLALAQARVDSALGRTEALGRLATHWVGKLTAVPKDLPRLPQAELALLLCSGGPLDDAQLELLRTTLAFLRREHVPGSPLLTRAETLAARVPAAPGMDLNWKRGGP